MNASQAPSASGTVSVIVVSFNSGLDLEEALPRIYGAAVDYEVRTTVVDNGSSDNSVAVARRFGAEVVEIGLNRGFAYGVNVGLRRNESDYVLLLNPDVRLGAGSIDALIAAVRAEGASAVGPRTVDGLGVPNTSGYYVRLPSLPQLLLVYTRLLGRRLPERWRCRWYEHCELGEGRHEVEQIPAACLLAPISTFNDVGPFDERFPIWFEDVDWCRRVGRSGGTLVYDGSITVVHIGGTSFNEWTGPAKEARFYRSLLLYFRKHHRSWPFAWVLVVLDRILRFALTGTMDHVRVLVWLLRREVPLPDPR